MEAHTFGTVAVHGTLRCGRKVNISTVSAARWAVLFSLHFSSCFKAHVGNQFVVNCSKKRERNFFAEPIVFWSLDVARREFV